MIIYYVSKYPFNWYSDTTFYFIPLILKGSYLCWPKWCLELWPQGVCRITIMHSIDPSRDMEWRITICCNPDLANMSLSSLRPSTGPNRLAINPLGAATDWNLIPCTSLSPLYKTQGFLSGLDRSINKNPSNLWMGSHVHIFCYKIL